MLPSTSRREPDGSRRVPLYVLSVLLVAIALLAPATPDPHRAEQSASHLGHDSTASTATSADGTGAGGALMPRESGLVLTADLPGAGRADDHRNARRRPRDLRHQLLRRGGRRHPGAAGLAAPARPERRPRDLGGLDVVGVPLVVPADPRSCLSRPDGARRSGSDLLYPQWNAPANAAPAVATAWQGYLARVELHEHGHRDIAEAAANDLARTLEALPGYPSCDALADAARTAASTLLVSHGQETGHLRPRDRPRHDARRHPLARPLAPRSWDHR